MGIPQKSTNNLLSMPEIKEFQKPQSLSPVNRLPAFPVGPGIRKTGLGGDTKGNIIVVKELLLGGKPVPVNPNPAYAYPQKKKQGVQQYQLQYLKDSSPYNPANNMMLIARQAKLFQSNIGSVSAEKKKINIPVMQANETFYKVHLSQISG
jgi:hypothetical protein